MQEWTHTGSEEVADYHIFRARRDLHRSPRTGEERPFVVLDGPDWVNVVATTPEGNWVMVRQFRIGTRTFTLEVPGGMVDPGETPLQAARRELLEETGYDSEHWQELGWVHPNPAFQVNRCTTYLAQNCQLVSTSLALDAGEDIEVLTLSEEEVFAAGRAGDITHALVLVAMFLWQTR